LFWIGDVEFGEALAGLFHVMIITELGRNHQDILFGLIRSKVAYLGIDILNWE